VCVCVCVCVCQHLVETSSENYKVGVSVCVFGVIFPHRLDIFDPENEVTLKYFSNSVLCHGCRPIIYTNQPLFYLPSRHSTLPEQKRRRPSVFDQSMHYQSCWNPPNPEQATPLSNETLMKETAWLLVNTYEYYSSGCKPFPETLTIENQITNPKWLSRR
jgi:hypothetical protein